VVLSEQVRERTDALNQAMAELKSSNQLLSDARLRAETAHQHLIDAIESISDAFVLFDDRQRIVLFNSRFKALWARSRARIGTGTRLEEIRRLSRSTGLVVEAQLGKEGEPSLFRLQDGRWVQVSERPTREGGLVILYTDITEVKQSEALRREQALAQKSRLLQRAVDNLSQGMAMVNAEGALELWNHRFLELCGLAPINAHRPFAEVMAESELEPLTPDSRDVGGKPLRQVEVRLFDGRMLEVRTHPLPTGGFVNTFTDITERHRQAQALSDSERWIRLITDHVPALIAYLSADLVYEFTNKVYEEWYCWPRGAMLGQSLREVHSEEHCQRLEPYVELALSGESVTFEFAETNHNGQERYMLRSYVPNRQASGEVVGIFVLIRDITERRRTAEALHQAYQHLEQRVRERTTELTTVNDQLRREIDERTQMEARLREAKGEAEQANLSKTKFLAAVSHDLLQPLNAARLFTSALLEKRDLSRLCAAGAQRQQLTGGRGKPAGYAGGHFQARCRGDQAGYCAVRRQRAAGEPGCRVSPDRPQRRPAPGLSAQLGPGAQRRAAAGTDPAQFPQQRHSLHRQRAHPAGLSAAWQQPVHRGLGHRHRHRRGQAGGGISGVQARRQRAAQAGSRPGPGPGDRRQDRAHARPPYPRGVAAGQGLDVRRRGTADRVERRACVPCRSARISCSSASAVRGCGCWITMRRSAPACARCSKAGAAGWSPHFPRKTWHARVDNYHAEADLLIADYHLDDGRNGLDAVAQINARRSAPLPALMITANYSNELKQQMRELGHSLLHKPVRPMKLKTAMSHLMERGAGA
jgi:PAS domain S-box-containing protein